MCEPWCQETMTDEPRLLLMQSEMFCHTILVTGLSLLHLKRKNKQPPSEGHSFQSTKCENTQSVPNSLFLFSCSVQKLSGAFKLTKNEKQIKEICGCKQSQSLRYFSVLRMYPLKIQEINFCSDVFLCPSAKRRSGTVATLSSTFPLSLKSCGSSGSRQNCTVCSPYGNIRTVGCNRFLQTNDSV